jgi:HPt (histidine-containing phosphotransfer) domain-containing protein
MATLDLKRFLDTCGPDDGAVAEMVSFYLTYMTGQLAALDVAIVDGRLKDVELIAHRCAGSNATYGLTPIVAPLVALEQQARGGRLENPDDLERQARAALAEIETALRGLVAPPPLPLADGSDR